MEQTDFLHADANSGKLKATSMIFLIEEWAYSKMVMAFGFMGL